MSGVPIALGLVGCGRLAEAGYLPALAAVAGVRLVAVADPDPARRASVVALAAQLGVGPDAAGHGGGGGAVGPAVGHDAAGRGAAAMTGAEPVATFADAAALLDGVALDGLIVATPVAVHVADARSGAAAGVAVLVEKPPALDAAGAAELAAVTPPPWVGFNRRFDAGAQALRQLVPADGDIDLHLEITYRRRSWGAHAVRDDALLDLGPHLVDWARWISSGDVVEVACTELGSERATLTLTLTRGRASLRAATDRRHRELVELRDGSGTRLARHQIGGLVAAMRGRLSAGPGPAPLVASLAGELDAFAAAIRHAQPAAPGRPRSRAPGAADASVAASTRDGGSGRSGVEGASALGTAADGVAVMSVIDAARASAAQSGRPVPVAEPVGR